MLTIDCPWCTGPMAPSDDLASVECAMCDVHVEIAPDPVHATDLDRIAA